jgi:hypothetical protein
MIEVIVADTRFARDLDTLVPIHPRDLRFVRARPKMSLGGGPNGARQMSTDQLEYIHDLTSEVAKLAEANGQDLVAYILRMAEAEAYEQVSKGARSRRSRSSSETASP